MSGLGELDRPGTPGSAGAWDARSEEWLGESGESETEGEAPGEQLAVGQDAGDVRVAVDRGEAVPVAGQDDGDAGVAVDGDEAVPVAGPDTYDTARTTTAPAPRAARPAADAQQPYPGRRPRQRPARPTASPPPPAAAPPTP